MERRPTWAKNFRRFGFKSLRSHSWAPSWRRNASLATSLLMDPRALARSTLPEPLEGRPAVRGLGLEQTVELGSPLGAQQGLDQGVRSLLCATARRTDKSYDSVGCWKDEPLGAQPLTSEAKENLRSIVLKGPFEPCQASSSSKSRDRSIEKPRCSRTSVKCCEARLLASSVGLNLVRADLELVRDKAGGRSELRSNCAERSRGSEVHKAEARAPSGLLPPAGWRRGLGRHPSA